MKIRAFLLVPVLAAIPFLSFADAEDKTPVSTETEAAKEVRVVRKTRGPAPYDLFRQPIDSLMVRRWFDRNAQELMKVPGADTALTELRQQLTDAPRRSTIVLSELQKEQDDSGEQKNRTGLYRNMVKSTLVFGRMYDCGNCENIHTGIAGGGVVISEDGIALTNYHVIRGRSAGTKAMFVMTWDGYVWPIVEVLSASESADIAVIRLGRTDDYRFHAAPLAEQSPLPTDRVRVVSHPSGHVYHMTSGEVSRFSLTRTSRSSKSQPGVWMEITAEFGQGSSGSAVFNDNGEIVGLVSNIVPLSRKVQPKGPTSTSDTDPPAPSAGQTRSFVELFLRRCVPLTAIKRQFAEPLEKTAGIQNSR